MATLFFIAVAASALVWGRSVLVPAFFSREPALSETSGNYRVSHRLRIARRASFIMALASLALVFSPFGIGIPSESGTPKEVAFVLDVSKSMDAVDQMENASRLDRAKTLITKIVDADPWNRYSLTVFAGDAFEAIPSTDDSRAFETLLSGISSKYSNAVGTDVTKSLRSVADRFAKTKSGSVNTAPKAVAVFLTDGGDAEDTPETPNLRSAFQGAEGLVSVVAVTYGSAEGANIPLGKDFMGGYVYLTDKTGDQVVTKANKETANRIAKATDGTATDEKGAFGAYRSALSDVEPLNVSAAVQKNQTEEIPLAVLVALFCFIAAFSIPDKMPA